MSDGEKPRAKHRARQAQTTEIIAMTYYTYLENKEKNKTVLFFFHLKALWYRLSFGA